MRSRTFVLALLLATGVAPAAMAQSATPLPLRRVRLYETGVGYFERTGSLASGEGIALPVPAGHLDDALKTLVVMSADGQATVGGIEFSSSVSRNMARALAGLPNGDEGSISHDKLLSSMKGRTVEVKEGNSTHKGRLVEVLPPPAEGHGDCSERSDDSGKTVKTCKSEHYSTLLLVTDKDEVRRFRSNDVISVRAVDKAWRSRVDSALDALSDQGAQSARKLKVHATGGAVSLGYVAETPVWRSTYRLVLDDAKKSDDRLQGWALLHNDTDEDWKKVKVELVNGRPDSFLFPLAAPRYERRELVTPDRELSTVPQLLGKTVDNMWSVEQGGLGLTGIGEGGGGSGYGMGLGSIGTIGHGAGVGLAGPAQSSLLAVGNLAGLAQAEGVESGAMFRYALEAPIDLRAHGSALLPFVSETLHTARVAYFAAPGEMARSAVHLSNSTRQTLPAGTIAVFAGGGFAGETALSRTKPGEKRILRFGFDLDVELEKVGDVSEDDPRVLLFDESERLHEHYVRKSTLTYMLDNKSGRDRKVYLALKYVSNARVDGTDGLTFDEESSTPIAMFDAPAKTNKRRIVSVEEGLTRTHEFKDLTTRKLRELAAGSKVSAEQRRVLLAAAEQLLEAIHQRQKKRDQLVELHRAERDIERLRRSVQALGERSGDMADKLLAAEEKVEALQAKLVELEQHENAKLRAAKKTLRGLKVEK